jgi:hypothetical protein
MNLRHLAFWRQPPIADLAGLAAFVDEQSAFLVQKGIYEYSRARAGHYAKVLFNEPEFLEALEQSRWRAFPLGLAMVAELIEGVLRAQAGDAAAPHSAPHSAPHGALHLDGWRRLVLSVFDRYPAPATLGEAVWQEARADLDRRLQALGLHPPKRAIDIPGPFARTYWNLMPIAKEIRTADFPTTHSYLKITLCNVYEELTKRADLPALVRQLQSGAADSVSVRSADPATRSGSTGRGVA